MLKNKFITHIGTNINSKIRYKIFFISTFAILTPVLLFGFISYKLSSKSVETDFIMYNQDNNIKISNSIDDSYYSLQKQIFSQLILQDDIKYILNSESELYTDKYFDVINQLDNFFSFQFNSNANLYGISLFDMNGDLKFTMNLDGSNSSLISVKDKDWFLETIVLNGRTLFHQPHYNDFLFYPTGSNKTSIVSISQVIFDPNYGTPIGVILLDQETEQFFGYPSKSFLSKNHSLVIFSNQGELVYSNRELSREMIIGFIDVNQKADTNTATLNKTIKKNEILFMASSPSKFGFRIISALPVSDLLLRSVFLRNNTFYVLLILLVIIIVASFIISRIITFRIEDIKSIFNELGCGNFQISIPEKGTDEISEIAILFNKMVTNIQLLIQEKYNANLLRKQAELDSLYSQINPHFLYNTLNSIKMVIDSNSNKTASTMLLNLSDFLRYTLKNEKTNVCLYEEIEHAKNYMNIQKERYEDKFQIKYEIAQDTIYAQLPWLTLQPLLENSMQHGIELQKGKGEIRITTKRLGNKLIIYVYDNGIGIPLKKLSLINAALSDSSEEIESINASIGIYNVNSRIKLHFDKKFGLSISSKESENTIVKITLPYIERS
ncbi:MAG: histidine kinase [Spirochaetaceae bacterium]